MPMPSYRLPDTLRALKALSDPTRLRLVVVLSHGELTVGELCRVLGQSQPRMSRHLRLLSEAGVLDRFRELQCIYYRTPASGARPAWLAGLLASIDADDGALRRDCTRRAAVIAERMRAPGGTLAPHGFTSGEHAADEADQADDSELSALLYAALGTASCGALLDIGTGCGRMLELLGRQATHAIGIDSSPPALRRARSRVHGLGLAHCEFRRGDMYALGYPEDSFDTVTISGVLAGAARPVAVLAEAARVLRRDGRLLLIECCDVIGVRRTEALMLCLQQWITAAGLQLRALRPCELHCGRTLIALAQRPPPAGQAAPGGHVDEVGDHEPEKV